MQVMLLAPVDPGFFCFPVFYNGYGGSERWGVVWG
jgi:hypothetical protein